MARRVASGCRRRISSALARACVDAAAEGRPQIVSFPPGTIKMSVGHGRERNRTRRILIPTGKSHELANVRGGRTQASSLTSRRRSGRPTSPTAVNPRASCGHTSLSPSELVPDPPPTGGTLTTQGEPRRSGEGEIVQRARRCHSRRPASILRSGRRGGIEARAPRRSSTNKVRRRLRQCATVEPGDRPRRKPIRVSSVGRNRPPPMLGSHARAVPATGLAFVAGGGENRHSSRSFVKGGPPRSESGSGGRGARAVLPPASAAGGRPRPRRRKCAPGARRRRREDAGGPVSPRSFVALALAWCAARERAGRHAGLCPRPRPAV